MTKFGDYLPSEEDRRRFMSKVDILENGHWMSKDVQVKAIQLGTHPFALRTAAWILFEGPLEAGLTVIRDKSRCTVTDCCNPAHSVKSESYGHRGERRTPVAQRKVDPLVYRQQAIDLGLIQVDEAS